MIGSDGREKRLSGDSTCYAGVDIGARAAKVVLIDAEGGLLARALAGSGTDYQAVAERLLSDCLDQAGLARDRIAGCVATGYGRRNVPFANGARTEISCHAAGCFFHFQRAMTVIDIGGQDNKIIKVDGHGRRTGFKMNRKCAAGTGAFLEEMAMRLDLPLSDMNGLAGRSGAVVELGSYCTVFTATEILEKIRAGHQVPDIVRGIFVSIAKRVLEMDSIADTPVMSGGVAAHNPVLVEIMSGMIGREVLTPPEPQLMGAWGAALAARDNRRAGDHNRV
ncbi:MAG: ATPase [Proteobacteria bacterium]|nr:ATPase [Pseudomonadota bacterium]